MVAKELTPEALFAAGSGFQHWSGVATFLRSADITAAVGRHPTLYDTMSHNPMTR